MQVSQEKHGTKGPEQYDRGGRLTRQDYEEIVQQALQTHEQDAETYLGKVRARMERVNLRPPTVEVRFKDLHVETEVYADVSRNLPSVLGFYREILEFGLQKARILRPDKRCLVILDKLNGVLKPGRTTLLLGPPSSGKTTLLKALAGALKGSGLSVDGSVTYNGRSFEEFLPICTAAYVEQKDTHIGELTVRETFDFAARCQGAGLKKELLAELRSRERDMGIEPDWTVDALMAAETLEGSKTSIMTEFVIRMLGLGICADTLVGDAARRGVSGGQKKRVTTGELIVGPKRVLLMDEISTGLDSSTTFQIVKYLRDLTHAQLNTTLISLLQPAPESYNLFDDVMLVAEGHIVYHGPVGEAAGHFEALGFRCPERKGVADFLQEVTSRKDQQQYWYDTETPYEPVSAAGFAAAFRDSALGRQMLAEVEAPFDADLQRDNEAALVREPYAISKRQMYEACWDRELTLVSRNLLEYLFRFTETMLVGVAVAFTFFRTRFHPDSFSSGAYYFSVIFFSMLIIMFDGMTEMNLSIFRLPGFFKQRDLRFYPSWAFVLPTTVLRLPYSLLCAGLWTSIVYYIANLAPGASKFFYFMLILFFIHTMGISLFRAIASLARDEAIAVNGGSFFFLLLLMCGGFLLAKYDIPSWWIWFYWGCDPLAYAQKGLAINEFMAPRWQRVLVDGPGSESAGRAVLRMRGLPTEDWHRWLAVVALVFACVVFNLVTWLCHSCLKPLGKPTAALPPAAQEQAVSEARTKRAAEEKRRSHRQLGLPAPEGASPKSGSGHLTTERSLDQELAELRTARSGCSSRMSVAPFHSRRASRKASGELIERGMVLPFQPLCLTFRHVNYYVPMPAAMDTTDPEKIGPKPADVGGVTMLQLLQDCSGVFQPGILTALVGSSGAGKTTLMDVLAGRKTTGKIVGDIRISGYLKEQDSFARISGYVEQFDIHSPATTVTEALWISSRLRSSNDVSDETVRAFVAEVEELVELDALRGSLVGIPGKTGLSVEQRKRLTIAVELVANPSIVFMDEPTSGLDARAAAVVMRTVRNTVDTGRTVVCTIHQPSIDIFEAFDDLLLMKVGGHIIYHGPLGDKSARLVAYFEAISGVPKLAEGLNPATWMLQVSTPGMERSAGIDYAVAYKESALYREIQETIERLAVPPEGSAPLRFGSRFAQPQTVQFRQLLRRNFTSYARNPAYNGTRFIFSTVMGLLFGSLLWQIGEKRSTLQDLGNITGALYLAMIFLAFINSMGVQPIVDYERTVSYREVAAGMYSSLPLALATCTVEIPYIFLQNILFCAISYWMIGFEPTAAKFFWYIFIIFLTLFLMTNYGIMGIYATPKLVVAQIVSSMFFGVWNLFSGFIIPRTKIPPWFQWYTYLNPIYWSLYGIIVSQLGDVDEQLDLGPGTTPSTVRNYLRDTYGYKHSFLGWVAGIMIGYGVAFALIGVAALKFCKYQKR